MDILNILYNKYITLFGGYMLIYIYIYIYINYYIHIHIYAGVCLYLD